MRGNHVLHYSNGAIRKVVVCFRSELELLSTLKGKRKKEAIFDGLPETTWRYEVLYPDPLREQYVVIKKGISGHLIEHVLLLASGGWEKKRSQPVGEREENCGSSPLGHER